MAGMENYLAQMIVKRRQHALCKNQVARSKAKSHQDAILLKALGGAISVQWTHFFSSFKSRPHFLEWLHFQGSEREVTKYASVKTEKRKNTAICSYVLNPNMRIVKVFYLLYTHKSKIRISFLYFLFYLFIYLHICQFA